MRCCTVDDARKMITPCSSSSLTAFSLGKVFGKPFRAAFISKRITDFSFLMQDLSNVAEGRSLLSLLLFYLIYKRLNCRRFIAVWKQSQKFLINRDGFVKLFLPLVNEPEQLVKHNRIRRTR